MAINNLWGELKLDEPLRTPTTILKEQTTMLSTLTRGVLDGDVKVGAETNTFYIDLNIVAPAIDNYCFRVLEASHGVADLYPVEVREDGSGKTVECANEEEFLKELARILGSDRIGRVIRSLVAQSNAA